MFSQEVDQMKKFSGIPNGVELSLNPKKRIQRTVVDIDDI